MRAPNAVRPTRLRAGYVGVGLACLFAAALLGVLTGPVHLAPADVVRALVDKLPLVALPSRLSTTIR